MSAWQHACCLTLLLLPGNALNEAEGCLVKFSLPFVTCMAFLCLLIQNSYECMNNVNYTVNVTEFGL